MIGMLGCLTIHCATTHQLIWDTNDFITSRNAIRMTTQINRRTPRCTRCGRAISGDDVNVAKDVAYCRSCNLAHKFSVLVSTSDLADAVDFNRPPPGVHCHAMGETLTLRVTHRSLGMAMVMLGVSLFWNGLVSVFVLLAIAFTLSHLDIPAPSWLPAPDMNGSPMNVGMTFFLWVFLMPFIVIGATLFGGFFLSVWGRTDIQINPSEGMVFTGVGPFGSRQRFLTSQVSDVRIDDKKWHDSDGDRQHKVSLVVETYDGKLIRFGSMFSKERRKFVGSLLQKALIRKPDG